MSLNTFGVFITTHYNVGRVRRSNFSSKEAFFMMLTVLKNEGNWNFVARVFGKRGPTLETLANGFRRMVSVHLHEYSDVVLGETVNYGPAEG